MGWIGVDFDGCLVTAPTCLREVCTTGTPIPPMIALVKALLAEGRDVRIFTARVGPATDAECTAGLKAGGIDPGPLPRLDWHNYQQTLLETWCLEHLGQVLPLTCVKDLHLTQFYDDRCIQVETNTGRVLQDEWVKAEALAQDAKQRLERIIEQIAAIEVCL